MPEKRLPTEQILTLLATNPQRITTLTGDLAAAQLHAAAEDGSWSANDILAHLRSCADVWGDCMREIVAKDKPTIKAINPTTWIAKTDYPQQQFRDSLAAFVAQRAELLAFLNQLPPEAWVRTATVTGAGKPLERTVHFYAQWLAKHERSHVKQFQAIATRNVT